MSRPKKDQRSIVFVSFESQYAKSGGLGAVMGILPKEVARREEECFLLAPYFKSITNLSDLRNKNKIKSFGQVGQFELRLDASTKYLIDIFEVIGADAFTTYLLASDDGFFTAPKDPYVNPADPSQPMDPDVNPVRPEKLVEDSLLFYAAVPRVLVALGKTDNLILHLQDWEAACVAQAITNEPAIQSVACILTLHNPYDRYLEQAEVSEKSSRLIDYLGLQYSSVLAQTIPLVDGPLSTVSQNFADELLVSPLHHSIFAEHLQDLLEKRGLIGIDNGLFGKLKFPFSEKAQRAAERGGVDLIQEEKWSRRIQLGEVFQNYQAKIAASEHTIWGSELDLSDPAIPVFLILGRDDPRQKGFDVVAAAIEMIPRGRARYIFTPIPGDEGLVGLRFLDSLAQARPGEVMVLPFRLDLEPFLALQHGSSFMVMCSLYEPFGAATEAYLAGMPVVARATGGLIQQVAPFQSASLSRHGRQLAALFHDRNSNPTGFLFREPQIVNEEEGWRKIVDCEYWKTDPRGDRVDERRGAVLFDSMAQRASWAFQDAIDLYQSDQRSYAQMIWSGFQLLPRFSWSRAVSEYRRLYDRVCD
jgi:glycogen synthase